MKKLDLSKIPMDTARLLYVLLLPYYRLRRLTPTGEKYKGRLRGSAVIVANHGGFADPFVMGASFWYRRMYWLAAETVMQGKLRSRLLKAAGAIKIDRQIADIEAIRKATGVLKEGKLLGMFPEGGIQSGGDIQAVKTGCVLLAVQANVPIIPMYIVPRKRWYHRRSVVIGEPIDPKAYFTKKFPSTAELDRVAQTVLEEMNRCAAAVREEPLCKLSSD
jgi:1-acyl-sn-glycerol-3-phosphate acyltransferase